MQIDPAARLTELAEAQKRLDDAMAQLATAIPEREVRALGSRINDLLAAFARATKRESGWQPMATAPKDGRSILVQFAGTDKGTWNSTYVCEVSWQHREPGDYAKRKGLKGGSGWFSPQEANGVTVNLDYFVREVGWMPVPMTNQIEDQEGNK